MEYTLDNRKGNETIYFIIDVAPYYGVIEVGQTSTNVYEFVQYTDKASWIADMDSLGIEHEEK